VIAAAAAAVVVEAVAVAVVPVTWFAAVACGDVVAVVVFAHCPLQHCRQFQVSQASLGIRCVFSTTTTFADC